MIQHQQGVRETPFQVPIRGVLIPTGITSPHPPHCWGSWGGLSFVLLDICINKPFELKKKKVTSVYSPAGDASHPSGGPQHRAPPPFWGCGGHSTVPPPFWGCGGIALEFNLVVEGG